MLDARDKALDQTVDWQTVDWAMTALNLAWLTDTKCETHLAHADWGWTKKGGGEESIHFGKPTQSRSGRGPPSSRSSRLGRSGRALSGR